MSITPEFVPWMLSEVKEISGHYSCADNRAFPVWVLKFVFDLDQSEAFDKTDTLTQGDAGLDGWFFDSDSQVFHLIQSKFLQDPVNSTINPGDLDPLLKATLLLQSPIQVEEGPHREKLTTVALQLDQALQDGASVSLDIFLAGKITAQGRQNLEAAVSNLGPGFSLAVYDTERLQELKFADDPISDLSGQVVEFAVSSPNGFFTIHDLNLPSIEKAAVLAIDGRSLADAVDAWKARLFHANVRYFLRNSNRVNKRMLETIDSEAERKAFWLYNNGLTIVAEDFDFISSDSGTVLRATNPQIVNGAQTSSVLRERRAKLSVGEVAIQCRIIAIAGNEEGKTALEKISEFTNSQSPVKPSDLRANDRRHRNLQAAFGLLPTPVFYERRRGEWQSLSSATRAEFANRRVTKEEVGQRFLAFSGKPAEAVTKKESIFGDLEAVAFNTKVSAHVYMLAYELHTEATRLLSATNTAQMLVLVPSFATAITTDPGAPTQLQVIRRATGLVAAHATSLAHTLLSKRYSDIGPARAKALRQMLSDQASQEYVFVWRNVYRSIRQWFVALPDKSAVKAALQKQETIVVIEGLLVDALADADMSQLPPINA